MTWVRFTRALLIDRPREPLHSMCLAEFAATFVTITTVMMRVNRRAFCTLVPSLLHV